MSTTTAIDDPAGLKTTRQRNNQPQQSEIPLPSPSISDVDSDSNKGDDHRDAHVKKAYGRTPDGTVFVVPETHDMVSQLLDPREPKNLSDYIVLGVLALHIWLAWAVPAPYNKYLLGFAFTFWRLAYNAGIGYLLTVQSKYTLLVTWARRLRAFEQPATNPRPWLYNLLKTELETKIPKDYKMDEAPIEYNTWLAFRRIVDLILMCDFVSYCLFAIVCAHTPEDEGLGMLLGRWVGGIALVGFNLWVKLDAHRVVKDYAWYWGDFFYLIEQELTFDGVFEMAPHPMYSIGYAGYYGISMMAASYDVLFISIAAHALQFVFLAFVENPHIEKTYNPPPPRLRAESEIGSQTEADALVTKELNGNSDIPQPVHNMIGSFDLFRVTDASSLIIVACFIALTVVTPTTRTYQTLAVVNAIFWRLWYSVGLGYILKKQSEKKMYTRHFLKFGESTGEAWRQWKGLYHISMILCHVSFLTACWKMYTYPEDWSYGSVLLKHVIGVSLIALQLWTSSSIYESLGEFGWFYGDFFFESPRPPTYNSIYRFLNNPERVLGAAGFWGLALITWSKAVFVMALVSQLLMLGFISFVEKPHMQKIYGQNLRKEAGLTKFVKKSLPAPVKRWQQGVDKVLDETKHFAEDFIDAALTRLSAGSSNFVKDTTALFHKPLRLSINRIDRDLAGYDPKHYKLSVEGEQLIAPDEKATRKESADARVPKDVKTKVFQYGAPIRVKWTAPANHSKKDWVGLYLVTDNRNRDFTEVPSLGRWIPTCRGQYDTTTDEGIISYDEKVESEGVEGPLVQGEMVFEGDKLWWTQGVYEFRYHHHGKHNVMSISEPFEVRIPLVVKEGTELTIEEAENALLPIVRNCLDRDPEIAPETVDEPWGAHVERDGKYAERVVYAIREMFAIEFSPAVVPADGNVKKLAWRVVNGRIALAPYSMSLQSRRPPTPVADSYK
ncbi:phosphatidylethanolamine N-methyltransferase [Podospora pseudopauciseta]|uniref:Phosphatidylethanolamine N-methyltransferase n=2 Tax=Podospora TaxID=5144 RepID=A0ABR0H4P0_9PEZI|nr:phosphatidylethanolamine N-methyltransferase [Podospora pseudopauciseta]KAK4671188.1 phosphatidylethanolamine N-methyltransferase [Podospora pseudoanserina]